MGGKTAARSTKARKAARKTTSRKRTARKARKWRRHRLAAEKPTAEIDRARGPLPMRGARCPRCGFYLAAGKDVRDRHAAHSKLPPDQQEPVAIDGVALRTKERDLFGLRPSRSRARARRQTPSCAPSPHNPACRPHQRRIVGPPAQLAAQEPVRDPMLGQGRLQRLAVEMRHPS